MSALIVALKGILVPSRQLNVDRGIVLCKRIYHGV